MSGVLMSQPKDERPVSRSAVELHIEELVLHGFAHTETGRIGNALESELTRLLGERDTPAAMMHAGDVARLDGGAFEGNPDSDAETTGLQLAKAIYGGLSR